MTTEASRSRIQTRNRQAILDAALDEFSARGFAGVTIDRIAAAALARLSKPRAVVDPETGEVIGG